MPYQGGFGISIVSVHTCLFSPFPEAAKWMFAVATVAEEHAEAGYSLMGGVAIAVCAGSTD